MAVNSLYWFAAQHKLVHVDTKNLVLLSQDLLQNGMSLLRASETKGSGIKIGKTKEYSKDVDIRISQSKG